eukprot:CAMPEP_0182824540 /NCGR_PEP_ID=MMETSP0006_2-20121128/15345_1 /TAXON_ID=97485 /ORGANISM="Prymnesium parvum, Strain Texoma1" /LENGTH=95 /DNA_ID=CAMNT_0024951545 /DNA_START=287 /DNA_END=574 /DNA_ORIENTATION=+
MQQHQLDVPGGDKCRDEVIVELVHALEVHALRAPHRVVDHIERRVNDELVQMGCIFAPRHVEELRLVDWRVALPDHHEHVVTPGHLERKVPPVVP